MYSVYPNLSEKLVDLNISHKELSELLDMSEVDLSSRFQGISPWELVEVVRICSLLNSSDVEFIFSN